MLKTLLLVGASVVLAGCSTSKCINVLYQPGESNTAEIGGGTFGHHAKISELMVNQQKDGHYRAQANIANLTDENQYLRYRISWLNAQGQPAGYYTPWKSLQLYPDLNEVVAAVSPNKEANNFSVQVCQDKQ